MRKSSQSKRQVYYTVANALYIIKLLYNSAVSMATDAILIIMYVLIQMVHDNCIVCGFMYVVYTVYTYVLVNI